MTLKELSETLHIAESSLRTNFPKVASTWSKKGILIKRDGKKYPNTNYEIEEIKPTQINYTNFKMFGDRNISKHEFNNEKWIESYLTPDLLVSNQGRYKWKNSDLIRTGVVGTGGYRLLEYQGKSYRVHRIILQSFNPQENYQELTVDHINGKVEDNRLENLRWVTGEQNTLFMMSHRAELNEELTRLIHKYGYDEVLKILQNIN